MTKEQQIDALKNPELRGGDLQSPVGRSMYEMTQDELLLIQGASDVNPDTTTTPLCIAFSIGATVIFSIKNC